MHCACVLEPWSALQWFAFITHAMRCLWTLGTAVPKFEAHLLSFSDHPALLLTEDCWQEHFPGSPGFCSLNMFTKTEVDPSVFAAAPVRIPNIPPWSIRKPIIDLTLLQFVRQTASAFVATVFSSHLKNIYHQFVKIYTDGSKTSEWPGCGIYIAITMNILFLFLHHLWTFFTHCTWHTH